MSLSTSLLNPLSRRRRHSNMLVCYGKINSKTILNVSPDEVLYNDVRQLCTVEQGCKVMRGKAAKGSHTPLTYSNTNLNFFE